MEKASDFWEKPPAEVTKAVENRDSAYLSVDKSVETVENSEGGTDVEKSKWQCCGRWFARLCQLTKSTKNSFFQDFLNKRKCIFDKGSTRARLPLPIGSEGL